MSGDDLRKVKHWRKVGWLSGDVYCGTCGRSQLWPCPQATLFSRFIARVRRVLGGQP